MTTFEKLEAYNGVSEDWRVQTSMETMWLRELRSLLIVPLFKCLVAICLVISLLVFVESLYMNIVVIYVKLFKRKPEKIYKWEAMQEDMELGDQNYPMVLVQIPMYNEREVFNYGLYINWSIMMIQPFKWPSTPQVFQLSIGAACRLIWPLDRLIVQVLDDSTDPTIMVHLLIALHAINY